VIEEGLSKGKSFITEHKLGAGKIVMLGSMPICESGDLQLQKLVNHYTEEANVTLRSDVTQGTIVAPRQGDGFTVWFVINMDGNGGSVTIPQQGIDLQTNSVVEAGKLELGKFEYRMIQFKQM
jgi:beta-galactosidase